ncbi:MAG: GyrI-like domain-containing protein [candidate division WOR-3 bacterium]
MHRTLLATAACFAILVMVGCGSKAPQPAGKTEEPKFTASVKMLNETNVAYLTRTGPYAGVGQAINELFAWLEKCQVKPAGGPFAVFLTGFEVPQESAKWEVCVPVPAETKGDKDVAVKAMPATQIAAALYIGPYDKVGPVYEQLMKWVDENGYVVAGPCMEFYLSDPSKTPAESLKTEITCIVKPKAEEGQK